jgi:hypothetical protein
MALTERVHSDAAILPGRTCFLQISPLHTASPSAASTVTHSPPTSTSPKPLTIPESLLWHRCLAHGHSTASHSLIVGYTKDDSMCTASMQAKHMQKLIKVKAKSTTKQFELIHSDVCGPFSTPTSTGHRYYIMLINDFTPYISVWVVPDMKSRYALQRTNHFRPELTPWDTK